MKLHHQPLLRASALLGSLAVAGVLAGLGGPAQAAGPLPTSTTVSASPGSVVVGQQVTLTATVRVLDLNGLLVTPTGSVTFRTGTQVLGSASLPTCELTAPCTAALSTRALPVGSDVVTATYGGDALGSASTGTTTVQVNPAPPSAPTLTGVAQVGSNQLTWSSASDGGSPLTSYRLYRSSGAAYALIATVPTGSYQDTTVAEGSTYSYRATTVNAVGESPVSNTVTLVAATGPAGSSSTTACPAGTTCTSPTDTATSPNGNTTRGDIVVDPSTSPHTATFAFGGPNLATCHLPAGVGVPATFNDTSTDAYKKVDWTVTGSDADALVAFYSPTNGYEGCLGLGTPWYAGSTSNPAVWVPQDGLYEAVPPLCANNGAFYSGGHFTQPCVDTISYTLGAVSTHYFTITYNLPPGDGRIGSGP